MLRHTQDIKNFQSKRETYPEWKDLKIELYKLEASEKYKLEDLKMKWENLNFYIEGLMNFLNFKWEYLELRQKQKNLEFDQINEKYQQEEEILQPIWENLKIEWKDLKLKTEQEIDNLQSKIDEKIKSGIKSEKEDFISEIEQEIEDFIFGIKQEIDNLQSKIYRQIEDFISKIKPQLEYWNSKIKDLEDKEEILSSFNKIQTNIQLNSSTNTNNNSWVNLDETTSFENGIIFNYIGLDVSTTSNFRLIWSSLVLMTLLTGFDAFFINNNIFKNNEILQGLTTFCFSIFFFCLTKIITPTYKSCFMIEAIMVILWFPIKLKEQTW